MRFARRIFDKLHHTKSMGLDARVFCNCVEEGRLKTPHPLPDVLFINYEGRPEVPDKPDTDWFEVHQEWLYNQPCEHEDCTLVHHRLGNIGSVGHLRHIVQFLAPHPDQTYPIIWNDVIYSGTHCADIIPVDDLPSLKAEVEHLTNCDQSALEQSDKKLLLWFVEDMKELTHAALSVNKPIAF